MLFRRLFFSALLVGGSLAISAFTFALTEVPFQNSAIEPSDSLSLFEKYGGYPTVKKINDQVGAALAVDPVTAPFLVVVGQPGHDTFDKLLSCLDLQFSSLLGGPYAYPETSHFRGAPAEGYTCVDMRTIHTGLNISNEAFDRFTVILADVLKKNGVEDADITTIGSAVNGLKDDVAGR